MSIELKNEAGIGKILNNNTDAISINSSGDVTLTNITASTVATGALALTGSLETADINVTGQSVSLGSNTISQSDKFVGVDFKFNDGSGAKTGFFGYNPAAGSYTFLKDATLNSTTGVYTGTVSSLEADVSSLGGVSATNYARTDTNTTFNDVVGIESVRETATIVQSGTGVVNLSLKDDTILFDTTENSANRTINITGSASSNVTLNSLMSVNDVMSGVVLLTNGATAFFAETFTIDNTTVTPKFVGGAPTAGTADNLELYSITVIKTADNTFTVLASKSDLA